MAELTKSDIRSWWADHPMTYGQDHGTTTYRDAGGGEVTVEIGSRAFFEQADATFYAWNEPLHGPAGRFSRIFDYERYRGLSVLEVGCGMGCMSMNWAQQGARVTAVDLNPVAIEQTRRRFASFGLDGDIRPADAEQLPFADGTFDFAYSWGVLHHTPGTRKALAELWRVLKPGGRLGIMLYNRRSFLFRFLVQFQEGFVNLESQFLDPLQLASRYGDAARQEGNPHTWPVTEEEVRRSLLPAGARIRVRVLGTDIPDILNVWFPSLGSRLPPSWIRALGRRWGWSLWIEVEKPA